MTPGRSYIRDSNNLNCDEAFLIRNILNLCITSNRNCNFHDQNKKNTVNIFIDLLKTKVDYFN